MSRRRLHLVSEQERLSGVTLPEWERLAHAASPGSPDHLACVVLALTFARPLVPLCVAPSGQATLHDALDRGWNWVELQSQAETGAKGNSASLRGEAALRKVAEARARCFQEVGAIERATVSAVVRATSPTTSQATRDARRDAVAEALRHHARHVVERYVGLFAHFAVSAVCHALDGVERPVATLAVFEDARGARAYQGAGLGAARQEAFILAAADQAFWEADRSSGGSPRRDELERSLAVQVFHEYLGGRYRRHADEETARQQEFVRWALSGRRGTNGA